MEPELTKNVRNSEHDEPPNLNTPVLSIEIAPSITVSLNCPLGILVTVHREEDGINKPCISRWDVHCDAWGPLGFMLFRHTPQGLKNIEGNHRSETLEYTEWDGHFDRLLPGQCLRRNLVTSSQFAIS
ncbi:unnamed protein product [Penicillium roqueforti FM164]|uniref:Genomic scaffold, ProqFM164S01 n=1 Tax=Penicillium roqueforti (strain FM164) TaxID=1365484 RepID=W6PXA7_PENRF|nr:unnamed protein product [Penicillium roqueforti FM164]